MFLKLDKILNPVKKLVITAIIRYILYFYKLLSSQKVCMSKSAKKSKKRVEIPDTPTIKPKSKFKKAIRTLFLAFLSVFVAFHLMVVALLFIWQTHPIHNSMFMILHRISTSGEVKQTWVESEQISTNVKRAVIASEDANFTSHGGFDIQGIENAIKKNQKTGKISAGGSTLSQQLAKNLFLFPQRSYIRKAEEAIITVIIEQMWTKERILTAYLNVAEFGNGIYGIESASQHYFKTSASNLTKRQSALLISMLPNPKYYEKHLNNKHLQNKTAIILRRMGGVDLPD